MQEYRANSYHRVATHWDIWVKTGSVPGNHYFGASRIYDVTGVRLTLIPGDELHNLFGGLFAITDLGTFEVLLRSPDEINMHFCKDYTPNSYRVNKLLNGASFEIPKSEAAIPTKYTT